MRMEGGAESHVPGGVVLRHDPAQFNALVELWGEDEGLVGDPRLGEDDGFL